MENNMSNLENKAVEILDKIQSITENYAPDVANAAVEAVRISSIGSVIGGLVGFGLTALSVYCWIKLFNYLQKRGQERYVRDSSVWFGISSIIFVGVCLCVFIDSISTLTDIWVYVGMFNPELALAHKISGL